MFTEGGRIISSSRNAAYGLAYTLLIARRSFTIKQATFK